VSLGVIPGYGGTQRLAQLVGKGKAMELILTARMMKADEALARGLVNQVVEPDELLGAAEKMATAMMGNAPTALTAAIQAVLAGYAADGFQREVELFGGQFGTEDFKEGTTAFIEKRKANFPGK
jgi:enoyl-CoA hydratase